MPAFFISGRDSFQVFVGVFDTCLVWYLLVLPSETHAVANIPLGGQEMATLAAIHVNPSHLLLVLECYSIQLQHKIQHHQFHIFVILAWYCSLMLATPCTLMAASSAATTAS